LEMSFTKAGRTFHDGSGYDGSTFAELIARAIVADFGASPSALRRVAKLTTASERTVRNWLDGTNGPSGEHLVSLMRHSNAVLEATLTLAGRTPSGNDERLANVRRQLLVILSEFEGDAPSG
jgi:hypothetical protein